MVKLHAYALDNSKSKYDLHLWLYGCHGGFDELNLETEMLKQTEERQE